MKSLKINKNIVSILNVTKNLIKKSDKFNDYYNNKDNNLYQNQLPLLMQRPRIREALYFKKRNCIQDLVLKRMETEDQDLNDDNNIIKEEEPPLCPFYNKKGEFLPEVVSTSKALLIYYDTDFKFNMTHNNNYNNNFPLYNFHFLMPMNKNKIKNINLYEKIDIHYEEFQNEILFEKKYENLKYNYDEIYNKKYYYKELINNLIDEIIKLTNETQQIEEKNKIIENKEIKKEKIFEWGKNKTNISLSLNSINIKIKSINDDKIYFEYNLLLNLVPLFYFKDLEKFKLFIISIIHWDDINKKFVLEKNIYSIINNILTNIQDLKSKFNIFENLEENDDKIEKSPELKKTLTSGYNKKNNIISNLAKSMLNIGMSNSTSLFAGTNVDIIQKKKIKKTQHKLYPKKEKEKEDTYINYNVFNFFWKTPNNIFQINVETPLIIFNVPSYNIIIKQYIDFDLLFYLFSIKFDSWDFYNIKFISSFKLFRIVLSQMASNNYKKDINIFLEKPKIKNYDFSDDIIINIFTIKNSNFEKENDSKQNKVLLKDKKIIKEEINILIEQKCFRAIVKVTDLENL